jgi:mRNA interferase RelE/StbE
LVIEPRPNKVKKLQGDDDLYRIRVGDYRIVYEIKDDVLLVTLIRIKHRSEVYKNKN